MIYNKLNQKRFDPNMYYGQWRTEARKNPIYKAFFLDLYMAGLFRYDVVQALLYDGCAKALTMPNPYDLSAAHTYDDNNYATYERHKIRQSPVYICLIQDLVNTKYLDMAFVQCMLQALWGDARTALEKVSFSVADPSTYPYMDIRMRLNRTNALYGTIILDLYDIGAITKDYRDTLLAGDFIKAKKISKPISLRYTKDSKDYRIPVGGAYKITEFPMEFEFCTPARLEVRVSDDGSDPTTVATGITLDSGDVPATIKMKIEDFDSITMVFN